MRPGGRCTGTSATSRCFGPASIPRSPSGCGRGGKDSLIDYCDQGKKNYYIASTLPPAAEEPATDEVLKRLSDNFELCVYGLGEVRRQWEQREGESDAPLLFG